MLLSFSFSFEKEKGKRTVSPTSCRQRKQKERSWAGERLQANMGIFCVSRIFGVTHTYVRSNVTVSPKCIAHASHFRGVRCSWSMFCNMGRKCTLLLKWVYELFPKETSQLFFYCDGSCYRSKRSFCGAFF